MMLQFWLIFAAVKIGNHGLMESRKAVFSVKAVLNFAVLVAEVINKGISRDTHVKLIAEEH